MRTVEHFCWVRAVERHLATTGLGNVNTVALPADASGETAPLDEAAVAEMSITCPEVRWRVPNVDRKPPPSGPRAQGRMMSAEVSETQTRMILSVGQMTTVHLEQPVAPLDLDIDMRPVFGNRDDALAWIESPAGQRFSAEAKALSLICYMVTSEC